MGKRCCAFRVTSIEDRIVRLRDLDLAVLRTCWHNEFGRTAPKHLGRYLLFRVLAYKLQADQLSDLDVDTLKVLERADDRKGGMAGVTKGLATLDQRRFAPPTGTVLVRERDRKSHRVMVMPDGFA